MNKKLLSLAVAAALAAPAAAMAEATLYGRLGVSIDYENVSNVIPPVFAEIPSDRTINGQTYNPDGTVTVEGVYGPDDSPWTLTTTQAILDANGVAANLGAIPIYRLGGDGLPIPITTGEDFNGWGVNQNGGYTPNTAGVISAPRNLMRGAGPSNRIGVKGSEDLGNGLKAIYQVELGVNLSAADNSIASGNNNGISIRNSFVGLAGDFGSFLVGRHDTPLKISTAKLDLFADTMADYNGTVGFDDVRADNAILYISPSFSGFSLAGALISPGGATALSSGNPGNVNSDQINGAWSIAGIYNNGPFYGSAAYESFDSEMYMNSETSLRGECAPEALECDYVSSDYNKWRFGLGLMDWNGFTLTAIYEDHQNLPEGQRRRTSAFIDPNGIISLGSLAVGNEDQKLWQVQAGYSFGNNMFKAMYGSVDRGEARILNRTRGQLSINNLSQDLAGNKSTWAVGFDHNFSKRTQAYVLYTNVDDDNDQNLLNVTQDWSGFSLGMVHKF